MGLTRLIKLLHQEMLKINIARSGRQRTSRMAKKTDIILLLVCVVTMASADLNKGIRGRVAERLKELGLENKDPSDVLPVHSRETRESKDCPNITEDLVTFELNFTDGLKPTSIFLQQVVKNDVTHETYGARYGGKEWIIGTANVRPYLNCLLWDSEELVEAVRKMIVPPSNLPYNFSLPLAQLPATTLVGEVQGTHKDETLSNAQGTKALRALTVIVNCFKYI